MADSNRITIYIGNQEPQIYDLEAFQSDYIRLGRGPYHGNENAVVNDIIIDPQVSFISRAHCTFFRADGQWYVNDDKSVNGLEFNGVKFESKVLHDGDKIYIGKNVNERCVIAYSSGGGEEAEPNKISLAGKQRYIIGRDMDCDIRIPHPSVSRHHCIITLENGVYYIADNNSTNGVILNGSPLQRKQPLEQMDKLVIADTYMLFCDQSLYFVENKGGVSVVANGLHKLVKAKPQDKYITNNVSLSIEPGEFVAIIGGSGAGKTTLLNCLAGLTDFTSGDVLINGESIKANNRSIRSIIGYVPQNDIVYDNLTLEHMLFYSAKLRMPEDTSKDEIIRKIDETLDMVELKAHRNTMISKLSGGQKKRASIAVELLASPKLFFLDEPSSGLDPGTEKSLMNMLKKLADTGKTVVMVTHTVQNIHLCDKIICMGRGGLLCFSGTPARALEFFGKDNMTDIYDELNDNSISCSERFRNTVNQSGYIPKSDASQIQKKQFSIRSFFKQFFVMTKRYAEITWNNRSRLILLILMPIILTVLVCIAFQADGNLYNYLGITVNRTNLPFLVGSDTMRLLFAFSCAGFWVGIFNSIQEISKERNIFDREQFTGVRTLPYILSKFTINMLLCLIQSIIMIVLFVLLSNTVATVDGNINSSTALELSMNEAGIVFKSLSVELFLTTFVTLLSAMCLGLAISAAVSNDMALVICPVCLLPQILFAGVACDLSGFTETLSKIITCRWACIAYFASSKINDMLESCSYDTGSWDKVEFENGFGIDEAYSSSKQYLFGLNPTKSAWVALLIMSAVCVAAAVILLHFKKRKK